MPKKKMDKEQIMQDVQSYLKKLDIEQIEGALIEDKTLEALFYECEMGNWAGVANVVATIREQAEAQSPYIFATTGPDKRPL